eukprot:8674-Heterococcus_DN1.PRE.2
MVTTSAAAAAEMAVSKGNAPALLLLAALAAQPQSTPQSALPAATVLLLEPGATTISPAATAHAALRAASLLLLDIHVVQRVATGADARCAGITKPLTLLAAAQHASRAAGRLISASAQIQHIRAFAS